MSTDRNRVVSQDALDAGRALSRQESAMNADGSEMQGRRTISLEVIQDRHADTRKLTPSHVQHLSESIAALGLIEPIVVDRSGRLLAGGHRLQAIKQLKAESLIVFLERFPNGMIPVRIMDLNADTDHQQALAIEVAENAQRRNYTSKEVKKLAKRLVKAGYKDTAGRPKDGEKSLAPALAVVIGCSLRTVRRHLSSTDVQMVPDVTISPSSSYLPVIRQLFSSTAKGLEKLTPCSDVPNEILSLAQKFSACLQVEINRLEPAQT